MGSPTVKAAIFDLGNVLINFDHSISAGKIASLCNTSPQEVYRIFFDSDITQRFEAGRIGAQDFFARVSEMLKLVMSYEEFLPIWNEIFYQSDDNRQVYCLIKKLQATRTTALLSNINELHFAYLKDCFPVFDVFHHLFASCELGAIKPDPRIYQKALTYLGRKPQEVFYVDDRPELIAAARELGIRAFVYRYPQRLIQDLATCGIEIG